MDDIRIGNTLCFIINPTGTEAVNSVAVRDSLLVRFMNNFAQRVSVITNDVGDVRNM